MLWAQVTIAICMVIKLMSHALLHGNKTEREWSFPVALVEGGIAAFLLWKSGAFSHLV